MKGTFETDNLYPWYVMVKGQSCIPRNGHTGDTGPEFRFLSLESFDACHDLAENWIREQYRQADADVNAWLSEADAAAEYAVTKNEH